MRSNPTNRVPTGALNRLAACLILGGMCSVATAQSSVTTYGLIDVTARYATNARPGSDHLYSLGDGAFTGSRLGFRGTEDLGDGLKAVFTLEMGLDPSTGTLMQSTASPNYGQAATTGGRAFGREASVGLSSPVWGTMTLGRQYTLAHTLSTRFQPLGNPNQDSLSVFSGHHVARQDNMVRYSKAFGPATLLASVTASEGNGKASSVGGAYASGPVDLVAYAERMDSFNGAERRNVWGTGGSYAITSSLKAYAGFMKRDQRVSLQVNKVATAALSWFATPLLQLTAVYVQDKQTGVAEGSRKVGFLAADYFLSKRTDVYAEVDQNKLSGSYPLPAFMATRDKQTGVSFGLRHRF